MKYVLTPTDDDILHYKKGSESKSHKYISRVFNKGKWVYIYAKNRLRGNNVTNKDGKKQYAPNIKTGGKEGSHSFIENDPNNPYRTVIREHNVLNESFDPDLAAAGMYTFNNYLKSSKSKPMVTNSTPYSYDDNGNWIDKQYSPSYKTPDSSKHYTPDIRTNMPVNPSLKTPLSYTQTSADPIKYDRLIRRDLGQKSLAEQYAEQEKKKK